MPAAEQSAPALLATLKFFYCGQGDTILVESDGHWGLIDCYLTRASRVRGRIRQHIDERGVGRLDFVCLTHPDRDHFWGLQDLLQERFVDHGTGEASFAEFWDIGIPYALFIALDQRLNGGAKGLSQGIRDLYEGLVLPLGGRGAIRLRGLQEGMTPPIAFGDFVLTAVAPKGERVQAFNEQSVERIFGERLEWCHQLRQTKNDLSIVLVMRHKRMPVYFILGGDATAVVWPDALECWRQVLRQLDASPDTRYAAVKASHHGAMSSHHLPLYRECCQPNQTIVVLSVGPDYVDHPHPQVLNDLISNGLRVYATCWPDVSEPPRARSSSLLFLGEKQAAEAGRFPKVDGFSVSDVEVRIWSNGELSAAPESSLRELLVYTKQ